MWWPLEELNEYNKFEWTLWKMNKIPWVGKIFKADEFKSKEQANISSLFKDWELDWISSKKELNEAINIKSSQKLSDEVAKMWNNQCSQEIKDINKQLFDQIKEIQDPKEKLKKYSEAIDIISALVWTEIAEMNENTKKFQNWLKTLIINEKVKQEWFIKEIEKMLNEYKSNQQKKERENSKDITKTNDKKRSQEIPSSPLDALEFKV